MIKYLLHAKGIASSEMLRKNVLNYLKEVGRVKGPPSVKMGVDKSK